MANLRVYIIVFSLFLVFLLTSGLMASNNGNYYHDSKIEEAKVNVDSLNIKTMQRALQRYSLDYGEYPEELDQLVPDYLLAVPEAKQNNTNLKYRKKEEGFLLRIE